MTDAVLLVAVDAPAPDVTPAFLVAAPIIMIALAIVGLATIIGLHWAWRRSDRRWRADAKPSTATDVWRESARRATEDEPPPPPVRPSIPPDPDELPFDLESGEPPEFDPNKEWSPDDEDDDDEDPEPWR